MWKPEYKLLHVTKKKTQDILTSYIEYMSDFFGEENFIKDNRYELDLFSRYEKFHYKGYTFSIRKIKPFEFTYEKKMKKEIDKPKKKLRFVSIENNHIPLSPSVLK